MVFVKIEAVGTGSVITECEQLIRDNLEKAGIDSILLAESQNWQPGKRKKFNIYKDQVVQIPYSLKSF